jgi:hypothetical protein
VPAPTRSRKYLRGIFTPRRPSGPRGSLSAHPDATIEHPRQNLALSSIGNRSVSTDGGSLTIWNAHIRVSSPHACGQRLECDDYDIPSRIECHRHCAGLVVPHPTPKHTSPAWSSPQACGRKRPSTKAVAFLAVLHGSLEAIRWAAHRCKRELNNPTG